MSQVTNLAYFYETARKVRGGKWVWVKDSNGENRKNVLLGGTILNPKKGFDHLWAGQLVQYTPGEGCKIFRSFIPVRPSEDTFDVLADGYSDIPEVGMLLMVAPNTANGTGASAKVTKVTYNEATNYYTVDLDTEVEISSTDILVEAEGTAASATAKVLVPNPNTFVEADVDLLPTEGYGIENANYSISTVHDKEAWIARMQPLPDYVLAKNRSYIDGIFWI
jgi:hypothetical protein